MDCISLGTPGKQTISVLPRLKTNPVDFLNVYGNNGEKFKRP